MPTRVPAAGLDAAFTSATPSLGTNTFTGPQTFQAANTFNAGNTFNAVQTFAAATNHTSIIETSIVVAAVNINCALGSVFTKTLASAPTFTVSNVAVAGKVTSFILDLTNGGNFLVTWWSGIRWAGAVAPTLTSSGRDILGFYTVDGGTTWVGLLLAKDVR
jgi:hypothetical protein